MVKKLNMGQQGGWELSSRIPLTEKALWWKSKLQVRLTGWVTHGANWQRQVCRVVIRKQVTLLAKRIEGAERCPRCWLPGLCQLLGRQRKPVLCLWWSEVLRLRALTHSTNVCTIEGNEPQETEAPVLTEFLCPDFCWEKLLDCTSWLWPCPDLQFWTVPSSLPNLGIQISILSDVMLRPDKGCQYPLTKFTVALVKSAINFMFIP